MISRFLSASVATSVLLLLFSPLFAGEKKGGAVTSASEEGAITRGAGDNIKSGAYQGVSFGSKVKLNYWAFIKPDLLRDVNVLYAYKLDDLCKSGAVIAGQVAFVPAATSEAPLTVNNNAVVADRFYCTGWYSFQNDGNLVVVSPMKYPWASAKELVSLKSGPPIRNDFDVVAIDSTANSVTLTSDSEDRIISTGEFLANPANGQKGR